MFPVDIAKFLRTSFFYRTSPVATSDSLLHIIVKLTCLFFDFMPPHAFDFDQKFTQNVAQLIFYSHMTKQFLPCLELLIVCFQFQNVLKKKISCFQF